MQTTQAIQAQLDTLLTKHTASLDTRAVLLKQGASKNAYSTLKDHLPTQGKWLIGADKNTWSICGEAFSASLPKELQWERLILEDDPKHGHPLCDDATIAGVKDVMDQGDFVAVIAVGSGTVNDVFKFASSQCELPVACIATAPSMNGYTSKIAAILSDGVKTTQPCQAPVVVIADLDVLANSPSRMIASGLGDLISKPVSNADWQLSAQLNGTFHSKEAMAVIELGAKMLDGVAPKLQHQDIEAMAGLTGSLIVSGLAMSIAGSSSPASGGEHLISHFIDMTAHAYDEPYDFHGCQVGVGTLTTAMFYEKLSALDINDLDVDARVSALPPWEEYDAMLQGRFGKLYEAVVKHTKPAYPTPEVLRQRLQKLKDNWGEILAKVGETLRPYKAIEEELLSADAPVRFAQLGVVEDRAKRTVTQCKDIRNRYTILHLAWELGVLEEWANDALEVLSA